MLDGEFGDLRIVGFTEDKIGRGGVGEVFDVVGVKSM